MQPIIPKVDRLKCQKIERGLVYPPIHPRGLLPAPRRVHACTRTRMMRARVCVRTCARVRVRAFPTSLRDACVRVCARLSLLDAGRAV